MTSQALRGTKQVEASTLSRSQSASQAISSQQRTAIAAGTSSVFDIIFPLFDEMTRSTHISKILYLILIFYHTIQVVACSLWPGFAFLHDYKTVPGKIILVISQMSFFTDLTGDEESMLARFIVLTVLFVLLICVLTFQSVVFSQRRRFIKWTLYPTRFIMEFLPLIMLAPLGLNVSTLFEKAIHHPTALEIVFFVLTIIYLAVIVTVHYVVAMFFSSTTYLSMAPTACWDGPYYLVITMGWPTFVLFSKVVAIFHRWFMIIFVALKIVFNAFAMWMAWDLPIVQMEICGFEAALALSVSGLDIVFFIRLFDVEIAYWVMFVVFFGVLIISLPIANAITKKRISIIEKQLGNEALEEMEQLSVEPALVPEEPIAAQRMGMVCQDANKRALYSSYGLDRSRGKALAYMRVGLARHCDLFLDWSLIKYVGEMHTSARMHATITQFLTFFPCEIRLLNVFFLQTISIPGLSWAQRFLLYQVHRVKGLRQSCASSEITEKLMDLKRLSQAGITSMREFWKAVPQGSGAFYDVRSSTLRTAALFNEALEKWPNNVRLCEEYSNFLVECATDYVAAVKIRNRADLIEQGKNFVTDISYRSLVRVYPMYLKRNITDVRGNFIGHKTSSRQGSTSSTGNSQMSTGTIDGELDIEVEEQWAKLSFNYHRVRLAYQRSLIGRRSPNSRNLRISGIWTLIFSVAIMLFSYGYWHDRFQDRDDNMQRQFAMNKFRYGYDGAIVSLITRWLRDTPGGIGDDLFRAMQSQEGIGEYSIHLLNGLLDECNKWLVFCEGSLSTFMTNVVDVASHGGDVFTIMHDQIEPVISYRYCKGGKSMPNFTVVSLNDAVAYNVVLMRDVIYDNDITEWPTSDAMCEAVSNIPSMASSFDSMQVSMAADQTTKKRKTQRRNNWLLVPIAVGFFVLTEPFLLVYVFKMFRELDLILSLLRNLDEQSRTEASKLLKKDSVEDDQKERLADSHTTHGIHRGLFFAMVFIPVVICVVIFIGIVQLAQEQNNAFLKLNSWMTLGVSRGNMMLETIFFISLAISIPRVINTDIITADLSAQLAQTLSHSLLQYNDHLLRGTTGVSPCIDYNDRFDQINLEESCVPDESLHDTSKEQVYKCLSLDRLITTFNELVEKTTGQLEEEQLVVESDYYHLFHMVNNYMAQKSYEAAEILTQLASDDISTFQARLAGICFGGLAVTVLGFFIFWLHLGKLDIAYDGALQVMRRLPPPSVIGNLPLLNYLLNRTTEKTSDKMTASESVIHASKDAVVCLNRNESIELVNQTVSGLFGYTPEQLLGQPISTLLPPEGAETIFAHFNLMRLGQCAMTFDTTTQGISDDEQQIPVHATVIGICDSNSQQAKSFAVIFRDETILQRQRTEAEEAKAQSEHLLYQILPRDIVVRLNQGETDISFSVPSASIIFVDIVKFSDYSATLSPTQIMDNLSTIFARFDTICSRFPLITKIKLIGDVYMAAAGLFTPKEPVANHASQVVQFALDVLAALEEVNAQLDSSLQVRIGVNTDGPLFAGVLGTDKPVFDIIGDPINVASRLQSTGIPGTVQVSQTTYDAIVGMNFNIEQRGEIELKGKGKKMAYIVRPITNGSFFLRSEKSADSSGNIFDA